MTDNGFGGVWLSGEQAKDRPEEKPDKNGSRYDVLLEGVKRLRSETGEVEIIGTLKKLVDEAIECLSSNTLGVVD